MGNMSQKEIIERIEKSIWEIAEQYQGDGAFYFCDEADVKCRLFCSIQKNVRDTRLVHAEWRTVKPSGFLDLVVWRPSKRDKAIAYWGKTTPVLMERIPGLVLAGIEIDCLYGHCSKANRFTTYQQLTENRDIQKLIKGIGSAFKLGYFLMLWDDEALSMYSKTAHKIDAKFRGLEAKHKLRSICISREGVVFVHGFMLKNAI